MNISKSGWHSVLFAARWAVCACLYLIGLGLSAQDVGEPLYRYCPTGGNSVRVTGHLLENRAARWFLWGTDEPAELKAACPGAPEDNAGGRLASLRSEFWSRSFQDRHRIPLRGCRIAEGHIVASTATELVLLENLSDRSGLRIFDNYQVCSTSDCLVRAPGGVRSDCGFRAAVPGLAQYSRSEYIRGTLVVGLGAGFLVGALAALDRQRSLSGRESAVLLKNYVTAYEAPRALLPETTRWLLGSVLFYHDLGRARKEYAWLSMRARTFGAAAILVWGWSVFDGLSPRAQTTVAHNHQAPGAVFVVPAPGGGISAGASWQF